MTHSAPGTTARSSGLMRSQINCTSPTAAHAVAPCWATPSDSDTATKTPSTLKNLTTFSWLALIAGAFRDELLHPPVDELGHPDLVLGRARDAVNPPELAEVAARLSVHAQHLAL